MLERPIVCLITDRARAGSTARLVDRCAEAARAGAGLIQVRERNLPGRLLLDVVRAILAAVEGTGAAVVVNDRADVALAAGAHGVHLRADSIAASRVRALGWANRPFVGRSVHSAAEARAAAADGCDYLVFGTVFPSGSKLPEHPVAGVEALAQVARAVDIPVVAVGGITAGTAGEAARAGAAGVAAIGFFAGASDVGAAVHEVRRAFDTRSGVV